LADIFTKSLFEPSHSYIICKLGLTTFSSTLRGDVERENRGSVIMTDKPHRTIEKKKMKFISRVSERLMNPCLSLGLHETTINMTVIKP
ncbi:hypothetical protein HAX54_046463, partial [Datura stramonium]|nr:hypothetical protein [Datura stramonium]